MVQVMPEQTQKYVYTFSRPGTYHDPLPRVLRRRPRTRCRASSRWSRERARPTAGRAARAGPELDRARLLTLRYVIASTVILGAAGILGVIMRDSQAGVDRVPDAWFYAMMTAHGLGAFVGWAAFAVMGFSYWVLAQVGFPLSRRGAALAEAAWWFMVVGVAGVVVTCLGFKFGASWVFLYPLPFHGAGEWGGWTAFFFNGSVLLAGVSILALVPRRSSTRCSARRCTR